MRGAAARPRIAKLRVAAFRGVRGEVCLDFDGGKKSIALFGFNGSGKSCLVDAVEWVLTGGLAEFRKEGFSRADYFHIELPDTPPTASIELSGNGNCNLRRSLPVKGASELLPEEGGPELARRLWHGNVILRQDALRDFVNMTKMEKLRSLEQLVGYEIVGEARDAVMQSVNSLKADQRLSELKVEEKTRWADLSALGMGELSESELLAAAMPRLSTLGHAGQVESADRLRAIFDELSGRYDLTERQKEIHRLTALNRHLVTLDSVVQTQGDLRKWVDRLEQILSRSELTAAGLLGKLYEAGVEVLDAGLGDQDACPLCREPTDRDSLKERLAGEISTIAEAMESWRVLLEDAQAVSSRLEREKRALQQIIEGTQDQWAWVEPVAAVLSAAQSVVQEQEKTIAGLRSSFPTKPPLWVDAKPMQDLVGQLAPLRQEIQKRLESHKVTEQEKQRSQAIIDLSKLITGYERLLPVVEEIARFDSQLASLQRVLTEIEAVERSALQELLNAVSDDVARMYSALHPGEHISAISLIQTPDRGVEFEVVFCDQKVSPPTRTLSESHLNCLGICLFLTVARRFATDRGFIILDDVVRSIDSDHRRRLARLLREEFADTQFLLTTHDDLWFDMLKMELPQADWSFMEVVPWTREEGVRTQDSPRTMREEISNCLSRNDVSGAANKTRGLYEAELADLCELIRPPVEYRRGSSNDKRLAPELLDSLKSHVNGNMTLRDKRDKQQFDNSKASVMITNVGSHYQRLETVGLSLGDITTAVEDLDSFIAMFKCPKCCKKVRRSMDKSQKLALCECGALAI